VFGSLDYSLTHTLMIQGSARYTQSDDDFHGCLRDPGDGAFAAAFSLLSSTPIGPGQCVTLQPPPILSPLPIVEKSLDQDNVSWRVGLDWKPQAGTLLYANVTKGYKAGGFPTVPALFVTQFNPIGQESVLAYEVGFKQALLGRSLQISGAGFYYDYTDKQILGYVATAFGNLPGLVSIPKSSVTGGELALTWTPVRGLTVNAGGTYVDSRVSDDFLTNDPFSNVVDIKGEQFPNSPKWQLTGDVEYDFPVSEALRGYVGVSPRYRSASVAAFGDSPAFRLPGYALLDLRAGIASDDGHWYAEVWGRNVTDQFYATSVTHVIDTVDRLTGMPATFGVRIGYRFR